MSGATCGGGGSRAPDASFLFTASATGSYQIDTLGSGFDTVLYVRTASCAGPQVACNDDANGTRQSLVSLSLIVGQSVVIVVDGYSTQSGAFTLNVHLTSAATPTATTSVPPATATYTATAAPTVTPIPTNTTAPSQTPVATNTLAPSSTPTAMLTNTAAPTSSRTPTESPLPATATPSLTPGSTGTATPVTSLQLLAVRDAWTDEMNPNHNRGNDSNISVYPVSKKRHRSLVQFDLSQVPAGTCVSSATLLLTLTGAQAPAAIYGVHRLTSSWTEGSGTDNSGVTWSRRDGVTAWTTPGGDFVATATALVSTGETSGVTLQWDVTADVAAFQSGAAVNYGWLVKDSNEGSGKLFQFASREATTIGSWPQLRITLGPCS